MEVRPDQNDWIQMTRVSHVIPVYETPGHPPFSGAENHLTVLLPALVRLGVDVELIVVTPTLTPAIASRLGELEAQGVKISPVLYSLERRKRWLGSRNLEVVWRLRRVLCSRRDRIIHIHLDQVVAFVAARLAGCGVVVVTVHNDEPWLARGGRRAWLRLTDLMTRHYIAITDHVKEYYGMVSGAPPDKLTTIYYGLELKESGMDREAIRGTLGLPPDRFVIGFVGRLSAQKDIPVLIDAMEKMPGALCAIVGDGELREDLKAMVAGKQLENVRFLGHRPDASELIPGFDVLCLPSRFEGLGLVLVESMLQRVPIVASRAGAIPEILGNGDFGLLFDPGDVAGLVNVVRQVQTMPEQTAQMVDRAFNHANTVFAVETMARRTLDVYHAVMPPRSTNLGVSPQP